MLNRLLCAENIGRTGHLWLCSSGTVQCACAVRETAGGFELGARNGLPEMGLPWSLSEAGLAAVLSGLLVTVHVHMLGQRLHRSNPRYGSCI